MNRCNEAANATVVAVASGCPQFLSLDLGGCDDITNVAVVTTASQYKQLTTFDLISKITDAAVVTVLALLTRLNVSCCCTLTDAAVVAVASGRPGPHPELAVIVLLCLRVSKCLLGALRAEKCEIVIFFLRYQ